MNATKNSRPSHLEAALQTGLPLVAISYGGDTPDAEIAAAQQDGVDIAELRIDRFVSTSEGQAEVQARRFSTMATIATIRAAFEGGGWMSSEADRLKLFQSVMPFVDAIDIELQAKEIRDDVIAAAKDQGRIAIVSYHNFDSTPDTNVLLEMVAEAKTAGADLVKISTMANTNSDLRCLARLTLDNADQGLIVIGMGEGGSMSRVFFPALGSRVTYSYSGPDEWNVPGQLNYTETRGILRQFYPGYAATTNTD